MHIIFLFFSVFGSQYMAFYKTRVLKSGVLSLAPFLKLHHVLLLESESNSRIIYMMDFSPINQTEPNTILKLIAGKWVPAEIRLRSIPVSLISHCDNAYILEKWYDINKDLCEKESRELSNTVFSKIKDREMKQFIARAKNKWHPEMNLYTHNCQHFASSECKHLILS